MIVESSADVMRYARVVDGVQAGMVTVRCRDEDGATVATVGYDVTALSDAAGAELDAFAAAYADEMAEWERDIATALAAHA